MAVSACVVLLPAARRQSVRLADRWGNRVTRSTPWLQAQLDRFALTTLQRGPGGEMAIATANAAPTCPMAQAQAAIHHLLAGTRRDLEQARARLHRAASGLAGTTDREALLVASLSAAVEGRAAFAADLFLELLRIAPQDKLAAYVAQLHCLDQGLTAPMLALARRAAAADPDDSYTLAMLSFAQEQNGLAGAAEESALAALADDPANPWAHHALAHVYVGTGRTEAAEHFLAGRTKLWERCGASMRTHNWWHLMLARLARPETDAAGLLEGYDRRLADPAGTGHYVNAVSMLARLGWRGVDAGDRWRILADAAEAWRDDHVLPFLDLHHALAFAFAGRGVALDALRAGARRHAATDLEQRQAWRAAGLPLLDAVAAWHRGDIETAADLLAASRPYWPLIGGSDVQRSLLDEMLRAVRAGF